MKRKLLSSMLAAAVVVTSTFSTTSVSEAEEPDASNGKVEVTMKDNSVTIGNDAIERTFSTADSKLSTTEIVNKRTDGGETNFTPEEGSEEFIVKTTKEKKDPISLEPIDRKGWTAEADSYQNASGDLMDRHQICWTGRSIVFGTVIMEEQPGKATRSTRTML